MTVKEVIEKYQDKKGLNDAGLARVLGLNKSTICRFKKGERKPSNTTWNLLWARAPELHQKMQEVYYGKHQNLLQRILGRIRG